MFAARTTAIVVAASGKSVRNCKEIFSATTLLHIPNKNIDCWIGGYRRSFASTSAVETAESSKSLASIKRRRVLRQMIDCYRCDRPFYNQKTVIHALYLAQVSDLNVKTDFVNVMDRWWWQAKPIIGEVDVKITSVLHCLGLLNTITGGLVLSKIGGLSEVDFLLKRFGEIGTNGLTFDDILSGADGLRMIVVNNRTVGDKTKLLHLDVFVNEITKYMMNIGELSDKDYRTAIIDEGGLNLLCIFRQIEIKPPKQLFEKLLNLSVQSMKLRRGPETELRRLDMLGHLADSFILWRLNPDDIVPKSWQVWFDAFAWTLSRLMKSGNFLQGHSAFFTLAYPAGVATTFNVLPLFRRLFDLWEEAVIAYYQSDVSLKFPRQSKVVADIIYSLSTIANQYPDEFNGCEARFARIAIYAQENLCQFQPDQVDYRSLSKLLTALRHIRLFTTGASTNFSVTDDLCRFMKSWCDNLRARNLHQAEAASWASTFILSLTKLGVFQVQTLNALSALFIWSIPRMDDNDREKSKTIWQYGVNCRLLEYDPAECPEYGQQFWQVWFQQAKSCMDNVSQNASVRKETRFLTNNVVTIAASYKRFEEFEAIRETWLRRLHEFLQDMRPKDAQFMLRDLTIMIKAGTFIPERDLMDRLRDIAASPAYRETSEQRFENTKDDRLSKMT